MVTRRSAILAALGLMLAPGVSAAPRPDWRRVSTSAGPGSRWDHTLNAHAKRKELILAFGRDDAGAALGDCWVADRSSGEWIQLDAHGPAARFGHATATDDATGLLYLFGGQQADQFFNDLWVFDSETGRWELLNDGTGGPSPRYGTSLVHDSDQGLYVSHGFTFEGRFDDTWRFDLSSGGWDDSSPSPETRPLRRCLHEAVWDRNTKAMWLYGGCSSGFGPCPQGDLWQFSPAGSGWIQSPVSGPDGRSNPSLTIDRARNRLLLFGGLTSGGAANDLWIGTIAGGSVEWELATSSGEGPGPRSSHDAVMSGGALYLFGGLGPDGALGDLWRLKLEEA